MNKLALHSRQIRLPISATKHSLRPAGLGGSVEINAAMTASQVHAPISRGKSRPGSNEQVANPFRAH